ncbi:MAG: hypothetical protein AAF942_05665 [Pseudomonadota bacterium]
MSRDPAADDLRRWGLRLAFVVTAGLVVETLRGSPLPPLAPVIALQLVAATRVPPGRRMVLMLLGAAAATSGVAYVVSILTVDYAGLYAIGVGLLYLWSFLLALHRGTALIGVLALTMTVVISGLANTSTGIALGAMLSIVISVLAAFFLVYIAYFLFPPSAAPSRPQRARNDDADASLPPALHAVVATVIILPAHLYLNADGVASMVVLLSMATMLRQTAIAQSTRFCMAFIAGNALGASLAALAALVVTIRPEAPVLLTVTATGALFLSWQITRGPKSAAVIVPGFVAYTMLFGLVLSPLPLAEGVDVLNRVLLIIGGAIYASAFLSLLVPAFPLLRRVAGTVRT